jgi:S1-C subfamily serine protease
MCVIFLVFMRSGSGQPAQESSSQPVVAQRDDEAKPSKRERESAAEPERTPPAAAPPPVSEYKSDRLVRRLKGATVLIKVKAGNSAGSGTGFVTEVAGNRALVVTNRHVVMPHLFDETADGQDPRGVKTEITAVFHSGEGPDLEESRPAELVAADLSAELNHDLALLQVSGLKRPIATIDVQQRTVPTETMKYTASGFPFGREINFNRGNPSISVTGGSVSGLRRDDMGQLILLQVDGSLQPGSSGGPLLDDQGRLIGVALAKVSMADTIGLAIPASELREFLAGRVGAPDLKVESGQSGHTKLRVKARVVDPNGRIRAVAVHVLPARGTSLPKPLADGTWPPLSGTSPVALKLDRTVATGELQIKLGAAAPEARRVLIQTSYTDTWGKTVHSSPKLVDVPEGGWVMGDGKIAELGQRLSRRSLTKLGPLVEDSDRKTACECQLARDLGSRKITLLLPAKVFSLSPKVLTKQKKAVHNAPRALADVNGDFLAYVQVSGDASPGVDLPVDPLGRKLPSCLQGAGLLLYRDKDNFLRFERACRVEGATISRELLVEVIHGGKEIDYHYIPLSGDPRAPLDLFLLRRKDRVTCMFSYDRRSLLAFHDLALDYPAKVKVGLAASNLSRKPFTVGFEGFVLVDDKATLDAEFGQ